MMMMLTMLVMMMMMMAMRMAVMVMIMMALMRMTMPQVKINGSSEEMLAFAAEMFGDKSTEEVDSSFIIDFKPEAGVGCLLINNGRPPTSNNGQHDCWGDLQGQADILHKVNHFCNIFKRPIISAIFSTRSIFNIVHNIFMTGCLMWQVQTCTQWGWWSSPTP